MFSNQKPMEFMFDFFCSASKRTTKCKHHTYIAATNIMPLWVRLRIVYVFSGSYFDRMECVSFAILGGFHFNYKKFRIDVFRKCFLHHFANLNQPISDLSKLSFDLFTTLLYSQYKVRETYTTLILTHRYDNLINL